MFEDAICASEDLLFDPLPTVEDQFQDCYETSPSCFEFKGHRFYDPEVEPDVLTFMVNAPPGASYFLLCFGLLCSSGIQLDIYSVAWYIMKQESRDVLGID